MLRTFNYFVFMRTTEIIHPSELNSLSTFTLLRSGGRGKLLLSESFVHDDKKMLENELNRYYHACGCDTGAKTMLLFTLAGLIYSIIQYAQSEITFPYVALNVFIFSLVGSVIGKIYGKYIADKKLKTTVHKIQSAWRVPEPNLSNNSPVCG